MLRVLTLATFFPTSVYPDLGNFIERQTLGLANRSGVEVQVVAPLVPPGPAEPPDSVRMALRNVPERERWKGLTVYRPRYSRPPGSAEDRHTAMARHLLPVLQRIRADFPFDVIDAENLWPDGAAAMLLARALRVPFSIKAQGGDSDQLFSGGRVRPALTEAARAAGGLLAVSASIRERMIGMGFPKEKIAIHYMGVDRSIFRPSDRQAAKAKLKVEGPLLVSVGSLIPRKGHGYAIEAAAQLPGTTLYIIGGGPEADALRARVQALGLEDRVRFFGVPHRLLPAFFSAADASILATSDEGLANVWLESLACGTPVVTTDIDGAREVIVSPAAGRIVARDASAIATAVRELYADPPPPALVCAAVERFSWEANAEQLEQHLGALLPGRRGED